MAVVSFPLWVNYEQKRDAANNSLMALLAAAGLAINTLHLTSGSTRLLPEVFPTVLHIERFNLTTDKARELLGDSYAHLSAMSMPYVFAIFEDFCKSCLSMLIPSGKISKTKIDKLVMADLVATIEETTGTRLGATDVAHLDMARLMRNSLIHDGGNAKQKVVSDAAKWADSVDDAWTAGGARSPREIVAGEPLSFGYPEMVLTLAVTKRLAKQINVSLQKAVPRDQWADIVLGDWISQNGPLPTDPIIRERAITGHARFRYTALDLTLDDLNAALLRL